MKSWRLLPVFASALAMAAPAAGSAQAPQAKAPPAQANGAAKAVGYLLGPEDVIDIEIPGQNDFKIRTRIGQDGLIDLPYLHTISASNRTTRQLGEEIARALDGGGFFSKPVVSVEIATYASRNVTVLGAVTTPGLVPIERPYRLSEILAKVGGARADGAEYVQVRSLDGKEKSLSIKDLATGGLDQDPWVQPGDKIYVPKAEIFYVSGQVKVPGSYPLSPDMTLRMAIAKGGGVTDQGSDRRVRITRAGREANVNLDGKIQPGDVIVVGERLF
jgi:polysaccharide export outer membrane protein